MLRPVVCNKCDLVFVDEIDFSLHKTDGKHCLSVVELSTLGWYITNDGSLHRRKT